MVDGQIAEHWFQLDAVTLFEQLGLRIVPGPRLLPRLLASPITALLARRRRKVPAQDDSDSALQAMRHGPVAALAGVLLRFGKPGVEVGR